jgi:hypothetical protein
MSRAAPAAGAFMVGLLLASSGAQAKSVRYDIEGQPYTYSTNNREQAAVARERIEAAKAAADARAKAEAERTANPLVRAFGSEAQRHAAAADARLREVLARNAPSGASAEARPARAAKVAKAERKPAPRPATRAAPPPVQDPVDTGSLMAREKRPGRQQAAAHEARPVPAAPKVEAIVFDFASGIKTIHMADGSVDEDVFDRTMAASLKRAHRAGGPRVSFVNEGSEGVGRAESPDADKKR